MYPASFEVLIPKSLDEALDMLEKYGDNAKVLAGGHSLIPMMRLRLVKPTYVIYIGRIPGLSYIREEGGEIRIGALTTHNEIEESSLLKEKNPLLSETASKIGDLQVRNMGTIGGSLAHADPAADYPAALAALEASVVLRSKAGERVVKLEDFIIGPYITDLQPSELLVEVRVPSLSGRFGTAYEKLVFRASDFAIVGVAALVQLSGDGTAEKVRVGLTGVDEKPVRARGVEEELEGKRLSEDLIARAAERASEGINPPTDIRASAEYRKRMARALTKRALTRAFRKAAGKTG
ncbi:aldehyde dehydrogenase, middle subunit [Aeropyrum pernix K1]|uniref:Aldehyde dehydrogenase, middle subunit n=1 Tax=Aeropyrum pernix (strain ATCC 700893 / DSM 11879 / JCM 9820 / NBRC 100138 / K1) TaxID=272557 RepID=Q9Y9R9_AERPE|nr:glyceraldehyde dehydrogenase subunit beta [Aeropyrum pernix]BAA81231.1 aldehyde dehydrogenase, middle subunit [Aeropyrum pernix K1]